MVSQLWRQDRRDWYDAAGLIEVGRRLQAGWWVTFSVLVSAEPGRDKDEDGNNAKLLALPSPFAAAFAGGRGDNDGRFAWTETIEVDHDMGGGHRMKVRCPPAQVPLEVRRTEPETTLWHLLEQGGVARWPYKSERVTLRVATCSSTGRPIAMPTPDFVIGGPRVSLPNDRQSWSP